MTGAVHEWAVSKACEAFGLKVLAMPEVRKEAQKLAPDSGAHIVVCRQGMYGVRPDAWRVDRRDCGTPRLIMAEIEMSNRASNRKVEAYSEVWFDLDGCGWAMELWIIDRFGEFVGAWSEATDWFDIWARKSS